MIFDQSAFLIAIGFAGAALALTALVVWLGARTYAFLLSWGVGLAFCVPSVALLGAFLDPYSPGINFLAFVLLLTGIVFMEASGAQFRTGRLRLWLSIPAWLVSVGLTGAAFAAGLSGLGVIILNLACGALFLAAGIEFWLARRETPAAAAVAAVYAVLAVTFVLCVIPLIQNGQYVLYARQENWAEDVNSVAVIIAVAAIGALMLVLAQNRTSQMHRRQAMSDPLTGLFNRRALFELVQRKGLLPDSAAIMFDLDHFKGINDRFGHARGDEVLVRFAAILADNTRSSDWAARLGGEEFCIIVHDGGIGAREIAERVRRALVESAPLGVNDDPITVSAGISVTRPGGSFDDLLRAADEALYQAKLAGRNRVQGPLPRLAA